MGVMRFTALYIFYSLVFNLPETLVKVQYFTKFRTPGNIKKPRGRSMSGGQQTPRGIINTRRKLRYR